MTAASRTPSGSAAAWRFRGVIRDAALLTGARWRIALSSVRRGARWRRATYVAVALALAFLGLVALAVSYVLTVGITELTAPQVGKADVIVALTLSGTMTLSVLVSFTVSLAALYLSADLDMLLTAPISRRAVFTSKLVGGLLPAHLVLLAMAFVPLFGHGLAMEYGRAYYVSVVIALLLLPIIPAVVGSLAVMLIVRHVSAHRLGDVVALVIVAMTLSIAFVAGGARQLQEAITLAQLLSAFDRLRSPYSPAEWLTRGIAAAGRGPLDEAVAWIGFVALLSAIGILLAAVGAQRLYYEGWAHMQSADRRREMRRSLLPWNQVANAGSLGRPSGLLRALPQPTVALIRKDLRIIPRDLTNMAQVLSPLAIGVFFVLQRLLYPVRFGATVTSAGVLEPLLVMVSGAIATAVSAMIMSRFCLTAFSLEGKCYWLLRSAPVRRDELIVAKFLVAYMPFLALGAGLVALLEIARAVSETLSQGLPPAAMFSFFDPWLLAYAWFVTAVVGAGLLAINLALGAARPNLTWDTPHEMLTPDVGCLSLVTYGAYGFVAGLALITPAATTAFPVVGSPAPLWALGLTIGLGVTAIVLVTSYRLVKSELLSIGE